MAAAQYAAASSGAWALCAGIRGSASSVNDSIELLSRATARDVTALNADIVRQLTNLRAQLRELEALADEAERCYLSSRML